MPSLSFGDSFSLKGSLYIPAGHLPPLPLDVPGVTLPSLGIAAALDALDLGGIVRTGPL